MHYVETNFIIKEYRKRKSLLQEKLAELVCCTPITISNIETGKCQPERKLLMNLVSLLDIPVSITESMNESAFRRFELENKIRYFLDIGNFKIESLIFEYNNIPQNMTIFERQFYEYAVNVCDFHLKNNYKDVLKKLQFALKYTLPVFSFEQSQNIKNKRGTELRLLVYIYATLFRLENFASANEGFSALYTEIQNIDEEREEYACLFPFVSYYYALCLLKENAEKSTKIAKAGFDCCIKYGKFYLLEELFKMSGERLTFPKE